MDSDNSVNESNTITSDNRNNDDWSDPDPNGYYRDLSLRLFCADPVAMVTKHKQLKELCLANGNPEAHYIEGIFRYFLNDDHPQGLHHLRQSSYRGFETGTYLYALLLLSIGNYRKGKKLFDKLYWRHDISTSNLCWERIKNSLRDIRIEWTSDNYTNLVNLQPLTHCHPVDNMDLICNGCYYFKRLYQFYKYATKDD